MKINLLCIGKTHEKHIEEGCEIYLKRLKHYQKVEVTVIPDNKKIAHLKLEQRKIEEGKLILKHLDHSDSVILLDERGKHYTSRHFSDFLQKQMLSGVKRVVFIIGGAFGFSEEVYRRANGKLSLSNMTFSHQMIRLFFLEQLYRANTILRKEPYHND